MDRLIGADIGGTKCSVVLGTLSDTDIRIDDKISFPTSSCHSAKNAIDKIILNIEKMLFKNGLTARDIEAAGISCGGPLDSKKGLILSPPNLPGWDNIHITDIFEEKLGIKTRLLNDADACAIAEWTCGAAKGADNVIFLTFGTGMGAGLILNGRLYSGTNGMAGEIGHVRISDDGPIGYGKKGSFEGFCSGGGIAQIAKTMVKEKFDLGQTVSFCKNIGELTGLDAKIVADAAEKGDSLAKEIYGISGENLGKGLSILIDILNPEVIVLGSIFARSRDLLWPYAYEVIKRESLVRSFSVCRILPAGLGEDLGDLAALYTAIYEKEKG